MRTATMILISMLVIAFSGCDWFNDPPVIDEIATTETEVKPGGQVTINIIANDPNGDDLTYEYQVSGGTINGTGNLVTWKAPHTEGSYFINITVSDGHDQVKKALVVDVRDGGEPGGPIVSIDITARVASVDDRDNILGGAIQVNDIITGTYTYDSTTPDSNPLPTVGDYRHSTPPYGITVSAGGFEFRTDPGNVDFLVEITNDHGTPSSDNYLLRSYNNVSSPVLPNGAMVDHISWQLDDRTNAALSSEELPSAPPNLADWESAFGLNIEGSTSDGDSEFLIRAHVTSAILAVE